MYTRRCAHAAEYRPALAQLKAQRVTHIIVDTDRKELHKLFRAVSDQNFGKIKTKKLVLDLRNTLVEEKCFHYLSIYCFIAHCGSLASQLLENSILFVGL